jgi:hypothetical protein
MTPIIQYLGEAYESCMHAWPALPACLNTVSCGVFFFTIILESCHINSLASLGFIEASSMGRAVQRSPMKPER